MQKHLHSSALLWEGDCARSGSAMAITCSFLSFCFAASYCFLCSFLSFILQVSIILQSTHPLRPSPSPPQSAIPPVPSSRYTITGYCTVTFPTCTKFPNSALYAQNCIKRTTETQCTVGNFSRPLAGEQQRALTHRHPLTVSQQPASTT